MSTIPPALPARRPTIPDSNDLITVSSVQKTILRKSENAQLPPPESILNVLGSRTSSDVSTQLHYVLNDGRLLKQSDMAAISKLDGKLDGKLDSEDGFTSIVLAIVQGGGVSANDVATSLTRNGSQGGSFGGEGNGDETCVFVFRLLDKRLILHTLVPIYQDFDVSLHKSHQHTIQQSPSDVLTLRISTSQTSVGVSFAALPGKMSSDISTFLMSLRRQMHIAKQRVYTRQQVNGNHGWLIWYALQLDGIVRWGHLYGQMHAEPEMDAKTLLEDDQDVLDAEEIITGDEMLQFTPKVTAESVEPEKEKEVESTLNCLKKLMALDPCAFNPILLATGTVTAPQARLVESIWKEEWLRGYNSSDAFLLPRECTVSMITFNCGTKFIDPTMLGHFFEGEPDLIFLCLQEMEAPGARSLLLGWHNQSIEDEWVSACQIALSKLCKSSNNGTSYKKWNVTRMVGLTTLAFVNTSSSFRFSDLSVLKIGTGIMGMGGNKGGIVSRFRIDYSWVTVSNLHLAADDSAANLMGDLNAKDQRNDDFREVVRRARFVLKPHTIAGSDLGVETLSRTIGMGLNSASLDPLYAGLLLHAITGVSCQTVTVADIRRLRVILRLRSVGILDTTTIFDADHVVFCGDLNYRMDGTESEVKTLVANRDFSSLFARDQLLQLLSNPKAMAFRGFKESPIEFAPTYKYAVGTQNWDEKPGKVRVPAYCDRVVYYAPSTETMTIQKYTSLPQITSSDHKPVRCDATLLVSTLSPSLLEVARKKMTRVYDFLEMACVPSISISPSDGVLPLTLHEGEMWWSRVYGEVVVRNTGSVQVRVSIASVGWMLVEPKSPQTVLPSSAVRFRIRVAVPQFDVENDLRQREVLIGLNDGTIKVGGQGEGGEQVMVVKVDNGGDKFFVVHPPEIEWTPTVLGSRKRDVDGFLDAIVRLGKEVKAEDWNNVLDKVETRHIHEQNDGFFSFRNSILAQVFCTETRAYRLQEMKSTEFTLEELPLLLQLAWAYLYLHPEDRCGDKDEVVRVIQGFGEGSEEIKSLFERFYSVSPPGPIVPVG
jgi:hypothetical protein